MFKPSFKGVGIQFPKHKITSILPVILTKHLSKETFEAGGFIFCFSIRENEVADVSASNRVVKLTLPIEVFFSKPEGLFTVEGKGGIRLELESTLTPRSGQDVFVDLKLKDFSWFSPPVVTLGSMDIPVEWLADVVIRRIRDHHLEKWVTDLNESFDIVGILTRLQEDKIRNIQINQKPELFLTFELRNIVFIGFQEDEHAIRALFYMDYHALLSDKRSPFAPQKIVFLDKAVSEVMDNLPYRLHIQFSFEGLERWIMYYLSQNEIGGKTFDVEKAVIRNTSFFETKLYLRSPVKGVVTVSSVPFFNTTSKHLDLTNVKVDVTAHQFFYQLTSPILERIICNRIEELSPIAIQPITDNLIQNIIVSMKQKGFDASVKNAGIEQFILGNSDCQVVFSFDQFEVSSAVEGVKVYSL